MNKQKNNSSIFRSIITMLLICIVVSLTAQTQIEQSQTQQVSQDIDFRLPSESKVEEFREDSRFQYKEMQSANTSWWDNLQFRIIDIIGTFLSGVTKSGVPSIIVVVVLVAAIVLLIMKLMGVKFSTILGKQKLNTAEIDIYTENVHEMNFDTLIQNALATEDYRVAVRFMYLKSLKLLSDNQLIEWNATKTNYTYLYEIKDDALRSKFVDTTFIFDYVWYGEFPLDTSLFNRVYAQLDNFNKAIENER